MNPFAEPADRPERIHWREYARCLDTDTDYFFPPKTATARIKEVKEFCAGCNVRSQCATWAIAHPEEASDGIFGGLAPKERRQARNARRIANKVGGAA